MIQFKKSLVVIALLAPISASVFAAGNGSMQGGMVVEPCKLSAEQIQRQVLPQSVVDDLLFMREEEKLARDVYQVLYVKWFANVFGNITQSEQKHMDQVKVFVDAYGLEDSASDLDGVFNNVELQNLYDELTARGLNSELEAFKVGALIEEVDIADLERVISETDIGALKDMYTGLLNGSYNHLRAFSRQITALEGSYTAQLLSQERVDEILAGEHSMPMGNADIFGADATSGACFLSTLSAARQVMQNGSTITAGQPVEVRYQVKVDANDVGADAEWLMFASYVAKGSNEVNSFVRNGEQWEAWSGTVTALPTAAKAALQSEQELTVLAGVLDGLPGEFSIMIGYRLGDGRIVYGKYPLVFTVSP